MSTRYAVTLSGTFNSRDLVYEFSLDQVPVTGSGGGPLGTASVFSYLAEVPEEERTSRPVVFAFNGGPGIASAFLHLSGIGPRQVAFSEAIQESITPPYRLEDSPHSVIDVADLVFIDPVNTGYGRLEEADTSEAYSVQGDARYFADIVRRWVARNDRWDSPKYVLGESYGTHRAPFLANALMGGFSAVPLDGLILLGQALNVQETADRPGNVTGALAGFPYKAATAWYHRRGTTGHDTVEEVVDAAVEFAFGPLAAALVQGNRIPEEEGKEIANRLEAFTGIPADMYLRKRLWLSKGEFMRQLLGDRGQVLGRNDSRCVGAAADKTAAETDIDPAGDQYQAAYTAGIARHLHGTLGVPVDEEYRMADLDAVRKWDWTDSAAARFHFTGQPSPFHVYPYPAQLTRYLKQQPHARLFIGTGLYDALTTVGAAEHLLRQYDVPLDRVTNRRYPAGHMMYTDERSAVQLNTHLREFLVR
ncbi:S10 family peptidase [Streptomyces sp. NPDC059373]